MLKSVHLFLLVLALGFGLCTSVKAEEGYKPDDVVTLNLSVEDWIQTQTAVVNMLIDAAMDANAVAGAREDVMVLLNSVVSGAEWRILRFDRSRDSAGLERWQVLAEARLMDKQLSGLHDKAQKASSPGKQIRVASIRFTPTLAERETAEAKLRAQIYKKVADEIAALKTVFPDRIYRVGTISFNGIIQPSTVSMGIGTKAAMEQAPVVRGVPVPPSDSDSMAVAERMRLGASIILSAVATK
ncbi:MAG: hypothetical protein R3E60_06205 [Alphaproteobacteria bacterium]